MWGVVAALIFTAILIYVMTTIPEPEFVEYLLFTIFGSYGIFALVFCLIVPNTFVGDIFYSISKFSIRMPGLIFALSLDGIIWFITVKLTLLIISFIISALAFATAAVIGGIFSMFLFPFALRKSFTNPEDSIWD